MLQQTFDIFFGAVLGAGLGGCCTLLIAGIICKWLNKND